MEEVIYLDNNSTTRTDPRVLEAMLPYFDHLYGNAASTHRFGSTINKNLENARLQICDLIGCKNSELIFSSGATESINLALTGLLLKSKDTGGHVITVETEHKAVLDTCKYLETIGFEVTYLKVDHTGNISLDQLKDSFRSDTRLVSIMLANNEVGTIHPIKEITDIVHQRDALMFCDATQAIGKIEIDVNNLGIDLMSFSAHKFFGPKGVGALYVKNLLKHKTLLQPLQFGGGHEYGLRSGTLNVPGIIGFGMASQIAYSEMKLDERRIKELRDKLERELLRLEYARLNSCAENRMYNVTNVCFSGYDANVIIGRLRDIAVSNGSACSSALIEPSHVLKAIGLSDEDSNSSIRFSLGKFNTESDINIAIDSLKKVLSHRIESYA